MIINHNIAALNTYRQLSTNSANGNKSLEKLSSGMRINRAGDDAAGLAISEKMRGQIRGLDQASRNAQDGISLIQTAEGALNETTSILQRMRELAVQSANDTATSSDRTAITQEVNQLKSEVDRIATTTSFNGTVLLAGGLGATEAHTGTLANGLSEVTLSGAKAQVYTLTAVAGTAATTKITITGADGVAQTIDNIAAPAAFNSTSVNFGQLGITLKLNQNLGAATLNASTITVTGGSATLQIGANKDQNMTINISNMDTTGLGVNGVSVEVDTQAHANAAILTLDNALNTVSTERAKLGAYQNRLEHTINNLGTSSENLSAAESRIRDVDMAKQMMEFTKTNILSQAATAMLAQANQAPQQVLKLLQ